MSGEHEYSFDPDMSKVLLTVFGILPASFMALGSLLLFTEWPDVRAFLSLPAIAGLVGLIWSVIGYSRAHALSVLVLLLLGELTMSWLAFVALANFVEGHKTTWADCAILAFFFFGPIAAGLTGIFQCIRAYREV
jgi:hypothetical protein